MSQGKKCHYLKAIDFNVKKYHVKNLYFLIQTHCNMFFQVFFPVLVILLSWLLTVISYSFGQQVYSYARGRISLNKINIHGDITLYSRTQQKEISDSSSVLNDIFGLEKHEARQKTLPQQIRP